MVTEAEAKLRQLQNVLDALALDVVVLAVNEKHEQRHEEVVLQTHPAVVAVVVVVDVVGGDVVGRRVPV